MGLRQSHLGITVTVFHQQNIASTATTPAISTHHEGTFSLAGKREPDQPNDLINVNKLL